MKTDLKLMTTSFVASVVFSLAGCGGGGGGGGFESAPPAPETTQIQEEPVVETINEEAETSRDLRVASDFMFSNYQAVELDLSAQDPNGNILANKQLAVYSVPSDVETWTDEDQSKAELLLKGRSDDMGNFERTIEVPGHISQLLVQLSYIGMENKVLVPITEGKVTYLFQ